MPPPSDRQLMSIGASEHRAFVRAKARFAGQKAQEHSFVRRNAVFTGHICHVSLAAFSPIPVMTSWPAWAAMAGGHNRRESTGGVGHARRSWNAVRDDYPRPSLTGNAARALPFPKSQRPTCPLSFTPSGTPPARPSAASASARCEPIPAFPLPPEPPTCPVWPSAAPAPARCEPFSANRLTPASRD